MPVLTERVCRTIDRYRLLQPGARVIVAVSGGADSTALACLLDHLAARLEVAVAGLAHFNHSLRGTAADDDEQFCRALAERLGVPFVAGRGDVAAEARARRTSVEDAGRNLRYRFLDDARRQWAASHVAVGHTRDDQAETLLLNLLRGAGTRGLAGMPVARGHIVRPLLECSHAELVAWLAAHGIAHREDESNRDRRFARNRLRHEVLPAFERAFPGAGIALARSAGLVRADAEYLEALASEALLGAVRERDDGWSLDAGALRRMPRALARSVVRLALLRGADGRPVGLEHAERLLDLVMGARRGTLMLPRLQAELVGSEVRLRRRRGRSAAVSTIPSAGPPGTSSLVALSIPGEAVLGDGRIVSSAVRQSPVAADELIRLSGPLTALVDGGRFSRLAVRFRQPGDRFRPLGMAGRRKLQDYFVDRKVPRVERDRTPLVVDEDDQIVWVAGHGISGDFRVSEATRAVVILKLRGERV